jgi:hypothetical protein
MKKIILCAALLAGLSNYSQGQIAGTTISGTSGVGKVFAIQEGTIVKVSLSQDLNGKDLEVGQKINFLTSENIIVGDRVVIKEGLKVTGTITTAAKSGMMAKRGKLAFSIDYLYLENGKVIKLTSDIKKEVKSSTGVVVATAVLISPLALFIGGKNAKYEKGTVFDAYVAESAVLE